MIEFCRPQKDQALALWQMMDALDHETRYMLYEPGERQLDVARMERLIASDQDFLLCAMDKGQIVGFLSGRRIQARRSAHIAYVVVGVRQAYQGRGIARTLLDQLDAWARTQGVTRLELYVVKDNVRALRLYAKQGYEAEGVRRRAMRLGERYVDEIYMAKLM